jgi:hypothetical protein
VAEPTTEQLEHLLQRLDEAGQAPLPAEDARLLAEVRALGDGLRANLPTDEHHYTLDELRGLVRQRTLGQFPGTPENPDGDMPEHLAVCSLCLDAYEVLLTGVPAVDPHSLSRFGEIGDPDFGQPRHYRFRRAARWAGLAIAAMLAISTVLGVQHYLDSTSAKLHTGRLVYERNGRVVDAGDGIPRRDMLIAREDTQTRFKDGSVLDIAKDTRFLLNESHGDTTVELTRGAITASVTKRHRGKLFRIDTPLGRVTVVGTKFRVDAIDENVTRYQAGGAQPSREAVTSVRVEVFEGKVEVTNRYNRVKIEPGQIATLREGPEIDIAEAGQTPSGSTSLFLSP